MWHGSRLCSFWSKCSQKEIFSKVSWVSKMNLRFTKIWSHSWGVFETLGRGQISYSFPSQEAGRSPALNPSTCRQLKDKVEKSPRGGSLGFHLLNCTPWVLINWLISSKARSWSRPMSEPRASSRATRGQFHFSLQQYFTEDLALIFRALFRFSTAGKSYHCNETRRCPRMYFLYWGLLLALQLQSTRLYALLCASIQFLARNDSGKRLRRQGSLEEVDKTNHFWYLFAGSRLSHHWEWLIWSNEVLFRYRRHKHWSSTSNPAHYLSRHATNESCTSDMIKEFPLYLMISQSM